jgi:hypothetical protein
MCLKMLWLIDVPSTGRHWEDDFLENENIDQSWSLLPGFGAKEVKPETQRDREADECLLAAIKC